MPQRVDTILRKARHTLTDKQADRYDDTILLDHLDDAQKRLAADAMLLATSVSGDIRGGASLYSAPDDGITITRISIGGKKVPESTFAEMDKKGAWEEDTGSDVVSVLFGNISALQFRFYPIPKDPSILSYRLWYTRLPVSITSVDSFLETPTLFDQALVHYIVFIAMHNNADVSNRAFAAEHLALYTNIVDRAKSLSSRDFTSSDDVDTQYTHFWS